MEIFIIFAIILLIIVGFGVQRLKYTQALTKNAQTEAEHFADFGSGRATPRERSPQERRHISKRHFKREIKQQGRDDRAQRRDDRAQRRLDRKINRYSRNYSPHVVSQTVIREVPVIGSSWGSGHYYYNPVDRYQAPRYVPSLSPECSDYAADRCTNVVPYSGCWNEVYNNCVDGEPTTCADYVADQCSSSTDFQSCFNFYNRVACPTIY
jgi:hypothetical protein